VSGARRIAIAAAWTAVFAVGLWKLDRALLAPPPPRGWVAVATIDQMPAAAGPVVLPAYLPGRFEWPPRVLRFRTGPHPGWWLGLFERGAAESSLWIGAGEAPLPEAMPAGSACVHGGAPGCEGGWHGLSKQLPDGRAVHVITTLDPAEASRVLQGLQHAETSR